MSAAFNSKIVMDPVHGTIGLSKLEADIAGARAFQRLHNVRQLGLAHVVFPGASYSRFSHSIGACHNAGKIVEAIRSNGGRAIISDDQERAFRLAALLHDIGHYPFSHATEHLISKYYKNKHATTELLVADSGEVVADGAAEAQTVDLAATDGSSSPVVGSGISHYNHEDLGKIIVDRDDEINQIFSDNGYDPTELKQVFDKNAPNSLVGIISSDLDCDRLDYLRRTAHNSGAPYGSVDINYIISQATLANGVYCFNRKALRAADHLLISRYYDYMQVPFNKTVVGLEWSLTSCIKALLDRGLTDLSAMAVVNRIIDRTWPDFDDQHLFEKFRELARSLAGATDAEGKILRDHIGALINRKPPKLICGWESVGPKEGVVHHESFKAFVSSVVPSIALKNGLDCDRVHVWSTALPFTRVGGKVDYGDASDDYAVANAVKLVQQKGSEPKIISLFDDALMSQLAKVQYMGVRVYYLPENGSEDAERRAKMRSDLEDAVSRKANNF